MSRGNGMLELSPFSAASPFDVAPPRPQIPIPRHHTLDGPRIPTDQPSILPESSLPAMDSGLSSPTSMTSSSRGSRRNECRRRCRKFERLLCTSFKYFPLTFVYSITTWAAYTAVYSISYRAVGGFRGFLTGSIGLFLYVMVQWSYNYAVFTKPGSPCDSNNGYSHLPISDSTSVSVTVKSDGQDRFCKKCQFRKPDRAHHCSSCGTCILKMDHHCPWLANCLGLYNYKAFLLFLIYVSLFCIHCFAVSCYQVYEELFTPRPNGYPSGSTMDDLTPVNWVLLAVVAGIIGLVITGFTIWHLVLTGKNMTTIESLEKVRYTAPSLRTGAAPPGAHLVDGSGDPRSSWVQQERQQQFNRYNSYLLEESSKKLPHAFNLGRARNFASVFGGREKILLWWTPIFSGVGDGWQWETSEDWREQVEKLKEEKLRRLEEQQERERRAGWGYDPAEEEAWNNTPPEGLVKFAGNHGKKMMSKAERILGKAPGGYSDVEQAIPLRTLKKKQRSPVRDPYEITDDDEDYEVDSDDGLM